MGHAGFTTRQVHGARVRSAEPRATPIYLTAGFRFEGFDDAAALFGGADGFAYTRVGNPTVDQVECTLADLEGGTRALLVASGQAATTIALLSLVSAGGHILASTHIYEGTRGLLRDNLERFGIEVDFIDDIDDPRAWEAGIRPHTRALFAESISNAAGRVLDIAAVAAVGRRHGIALVVDSTFATPYLLRPIEHGADVVVHSASKFLAGHGSVLGGVIVDSGRFDPVAAAGRYPHLVTRGRDGRPSAVDRAGGDARIAYARDDLAPRFGPTPSPLNAFLIGQGLETLSLRVERQSATALRVARWLAAQPGVERVDHPGLPGHPSHRLAERYLPGGGGSVFTVTLAGDAETGLAAARRFIEALALITHMTHLGDVRSLALHPASTSHAHLSEVERAAVGVHPGTVRLSIGIEDVDDLIADLAGALSAAETGRVGAEQVSAGRTAAEPVPA
ncbi:aminotransferase class V-fold PLP-dependent enzyme [Microbacterium sp. NPDC077184]|uniref:O-acetylhomoserine aminocarboxypropyltransferase/cysteine synthase family protein n=1 Tax=Microbacterium sp. NPDC077184 TaxID=3154764 RepID=UPI0034244E99